MPSGPTSSLTSSWATRSKAARSGSWPTPPKRSSTFEADRAGQLVARLSEIIDFEHWCFACGRLNPHGLHLDFEVSRDRAEARFTGEPQHSGFEGTLHGGVVTALIDETMGWAIFHQGVWGVTGRITVSFRHPVPVGEELLVTGEITKRTHRAI